MQVLNAFIIIQELGNIRPGHMTIYLKIHIDTFLSDEPEIVFCDFCDSGENPFCQQNKEF